MHSRAIVAEVSAIPLGYGMGFRSLPPGDGGDQPSIISLSSRDRDSIIKWYFENKINLLSLHLFLFH